ncbi:MAG: Mur ligase family protein [bacterium]|nr:Mur ligase family protein [bacterium]
MAIFFNILEFLIFTKLFLFWLWLWQLKEYHTGRFLAHFETQKIKKFISSFWRLKYPKFTKKIISIFLSGTLLAILWFSFSRATAKGEEESLLSSTFSGILLIILAPLFSSLLVLLFQIPTVFWRKIIINKARGKREQFKNLLVIGITGSYGKTSTKEFLATILSEKFKVFKTKEHQNSEVGISQCILNDSKEEHEIFVVEMGAYNRGGIKLLCDIAKPKIGVVTGVNEQHLATFGKMKNLLSAEGGGELIESLPEDGIAFFNAKNKHCLELYKRTPNQSKLGTGQAKIKKFLYGENATFAGGENILGAMAVAKELGMTDEEISRGVEKIENKFPGIQIKKGIEGINVIDATYSANPDGVIAHLEYLKNFTGRKIIVMPCLIELGSASKEVHKKIGKKIAEVCGLAIITTKDRFKEIREGALLRQGYGGREIEKNNILFLENPQEIFEKIKSFLERDLSSEASAKEDVILLESRVPNQLIRQLAF